MKTPDCLVVLDGGSGARRDKSAGDNQSRGLVATPDSAQATARRFVASPKIQPKHLARSAYVYIRQSSPQQVLNNRESRERQYALVDLAVQMGWPRERVRVIDEDQGRSGKSADRRNGFQKILADVSLDQGGIVLGLEMSRMARSCRDAYQLMEVCGVFSTLLADFDGVYDPMDVNDRLVLGLKATISEMELHTMRNRLALGKLNKARRGALFSFVPMGYVRTAAGEVVLDPDEQVQATIRLVFRKFAELKSVHAVLRYLVQTGVRLPVRPRGGPNRGQLEWRRPSHSTLMDVLQHPLYAGAYCYGRYRSDARGARSGGPGSGVQRVAPEQAQVLLKDELPAYITWEQFQENQRQIAENRSKCDTRGVPRRGVALLAGLLVCGRCGYRLRASYGNRKQPRYICCAGQNLYGLNSCQSLEGHTLDKLVARQVLRTLEPAGLELSLEAGNSLQQERQRQHKQWQLRLERARYESERAARQYHAVEPENRLVARELERGWERSLIAQRELEDEYAHWQQSTPAQLSAAERARIEQLAKDVPAVWHATTTTDADRKTIVRHLIEHVVINVEGTSEIVQATIHWAGGFQSQHQFRRRVASYGQLADFDQLLQRVAQLRDEGQTNGQIAEQLMQDGYRPPHGDRFSCKAISRLHSQARSARSRAQSCNSTSASDMSSDAVPGLHEWWGSDLARELNVPVSTIHNWKQRGWIQARRYRGWPDRCIYYANSSELERLRQLRTYDRPIRNQPYPSELTTPLTNDS